MGLDMYAYTAPADLISDDQVDFTTKIFPNGDRIEGVNYDFAYWRKFNHLHGWMECLYRQKGGSHENFNCTPVRLMPEDLDHLEDAAMVGLSPTSGFFFGETRPFDDDDKTEVLDFINKARAAINAGEAVIYNSWW